MVLYYGKKSRGLGRARVESEWRAGWASTCWTELLGIWLPTPIAISRRHPFQGSACANDSWCWGFSLKPWLPLVFEAWASHHVTPCFAVSWDLGRCPVAASFFPSSAYVASERQNRDEIIYSWEEGSASTMDQLVFYVLWSSMKEVVEFTSTPLPMSQSYQTIFLCLVQIQFPTALTMSPLWLWLHTYVPRLKHWH